MATLIHAVSGLTIKEINDPISWLFRHDREVSSFTLKPNDNNPHPSGMMIAHMDNNTELHFTWADHELMIDRVFNSRAWSNHFSGIQCIVMGRLPEARLDLRIQ